LWALYAISSEMAKGTNWVRMQISLGGDMQLHTKALSTLATLVADFGDSRRF